jgi:hypothetical protein
VADKPSRHKQAKKKRQSKHSSPKKPTAPVKPRRLDPVPQF